MSIKYLSDSVRLSIVNCHFHISIDTCRFCDTQNTYLLKNAVPFISIYFANKMTLTLINIDHCPIGQEAQFIKFE